MSLTRTLAALLLLTLSACNYEPGGENPVEVLPPADLKQTLMLNPNQDTIYLYHPNQTLSYVLEPDGRTVVDVTFVFNEEEIYHNEYPTEEETRLNFPLYDLSDGTYQLEATVRTTTGSGSLADRNGLELAVVTYRWTVVVLTSPPPPIEITTIEPFAGSLRIAWKPYSRGDFKKYRVSRVIGYDEEYGGYSFVEPLATLTEQGNTECVDTSYVGGTTAYLIEVANPDYYGYYSYEIDEFIYRSGSPKAFIDSLPSFYPNQQSEQSITLSWSACRYPANFRRYSLYQNLYHPEGYIYGLPTPVAILDDVTDTTYAVTAPVFGQAVVYDLYTNEPFANDLSSYPKLS